MKKRCAPNLGKNGSRALIKSIWRRVQKNFEPRTTQEQSPQKVRRGIMFWIHIFRATPIRTLLQTQGVVAVVGSTDAPIVIIDRGEQLDMRDKPS